MNLCCCFVGARQQRLVVPLVVARSSITASLREPPPPLSSSLSWSTFQTSACEHFRSYATVFFEYSLLRAVRAVDNKRGGVCFIKRPSAQLGLIHEEQRSINSRHGGG